MEVGPCHQDRHHANRASNVLLSNTGCEHVSPPTHNGCEHVSPPTHNGCEHVSPPTHTGCEHVSPPTHTGVSHLLMQYHPSQTIRPHPFSYQCHHPGIKEPHRLLQRHGEDRVHQPALLIHGEHRRWAIETTIQNGWPGDKSSYQETHKWQ